MGNGFVTVNTVYYIYRRNDQSFHQLQAVAMSLAMSVAMSVAVSVGQCIRQKAFG